MMNNWRDYQRSLGPVTHELDVRTGKTVLVDPSEEKQRRQAWIVVICAIVLLLAAIFGGGQ